MNDINVGTRPRPWGYWATFGWALLAGLLAAMIAVAATLWWRPGILSESTDLKYDAPLLCVGTIAWVVIETSALAFVARLAHWPAGEYLGLIRPSRGDATLAFVLLVLFLFGFDAVTYVLGRDIVTPFQVDSYLSARASGGLPLLWFTFVVAAPAGEEIMFRGFLYRGWVRSQRGVVPGVVVISALWTAMHTQYDWFVLVQVFIMGLLFGWVRWRSGSAALTILMHASANLWATMETVVKMHRPF